jgi:hypothetical protein
MVENKARRAPPTISFHLPRQVAHELSNWESKRRYAQERKNILSSIDYYRYVYTTLKSVVLDVNESLKLPDDFIYDKFDDLLHLGSSPHKPFIRGDGNKPGLIALMPLNPEAPKFEDGHMWRYLSSFYQCRTPRTRAVLVRRIKNNEWESWQTQIIDELDDLTMSARTFLQAQLLIDQQQHPGYYQGWAGVSSQDDGGEQNTQ